VPINAVCPECQNRFQLQEVMIGKSMRCPSCQEVFIVRDAGPGAAPASPKPEEKPPAPTAPPRTRADSPAVVSRSGSITDFVQMIRDVKPATPPLPPTRTAPPTAVPPPKPQEPPRAEKIKPPTPGDFPWDEGSKKPAPPPKPAPPQTKSAPPLKVEKIKPPTPGDFPWDEGPKPKSKPPAPVETTWSPDIKPPDEPIDLEPVDQRTDTYEGDETKAPTPRPERPRKKSRLVFLAAMIVFVFAGLGAGGFFLWRYVNTAPERMFAAGKKEYDAGNFDQARAIYSKLVTEHPDHNLAPEAQFFAELSDVRHSVRLVGNKEDPQPSVNLWNKFLKSIQDDKLKPFAAKDRFALDIWDTGKRLAEDVIAKASSSFTEESPDESEKWLNVASAVEKELEQFRPDDADKPVNLQKDIAELHKRIDEARMVLAKLNRISEILGDGSDERREAAERMAKEVGLDKHPRFAGMLAAKEEEIQAKATYTKERSPIAPGTVPDDGLTSLLFVPRFDRGERRPIAGISAVFFCLARGVLYALDESDGRVLWAARTGLDTDIMPVKVPQSALHPELVLIASNTGNHFGITARNARNGIPLWHQPLSVPCQGPPVVVGPNAYVSLGDRDGTVLEITLATGDIVGRITIGRPLGPNLAARPGTGMLYVPADSRAVYVFQVDHYDADGKRLAATRLGVMNTGHPAGSLRGVPVFSNPDPNEPGPRYLILGQADGLESMKLRAYRIADDGRSEEGTEPVEIVLPGWASFPPHCDGEKLAIVTDKGEFGLYGLALAGNRDLALFAFPARPGNPNDPRPSRGQVIIAEESAFWILASGELRKLRFGINATDGVRLIPYSDPIAVGEPLHNPQVNAKADTFVVVTQEGMTCRATAVNSLTGEVRWRRELGLMAKGDPLRIGDDIILLDHGGGIYRIDTKQLPGKGGATWLVDDRWLVAQPSRGFTAVTGLIRGPGNTALAVLAGEDAKGPKLLVRKYNGAGIDDRILNLTHSLAGQPIVSGTMLILPMSNGTLYRLPILNNGATLESGPSWHAERLSGPATCYMAAIDANEFFATDGARAIVRWRWPANSKLFEMQGRLPLPERPQATPVVIPGSPPRLVIGDGKGNLMMWDAEKLAPPALKAWRPATKKVFPAGAINDGLRLENDPSGSQRIVYSVGGRMVWLSPDADGPKWVSPPPMKGVEGRPVIAGSRIFVTDRAGVVWQMDIETGKATRDEFRLTGSHAFASSAVPLLAPRITIPLVDGFTGQVVDFLPTTLGPDRVLVPLVDGTVALGEIQPRVDEFPIKFVPLVGQFLPTS
jgi:outer membrane protein assembly factor BamB